MRLFSRLLLLPLAITAQVTFAQAESATQTVGGVAFNLPAPEGYCIASQNNLADAQFIAIVGGLLQGAQNKLIMTTVECNRLKRLRDGDGGKIPDYALYYTPFAVENAAFPGDQKALRKELCNEMRKQGNATLDGVKDIVAQKAKEMGQNFGVSSTSYIGVVDEDDHGCYAALLVGVKDNAGNNTIMSSIVTSTVVKSKPLFFAYYAEYVGPETTTAGVQAAKKTAAELDATNK